VFVEDETEKPTEIRVGGLQSNGTLELLIEGRRYAQTDEKIPLPKYPFAEMTWKQWLAQHPQTTIYVGGNSAG